MLNCAKVWQQRNPQEFIYTLWAATANLPAESKKIVRRKLDKFLQTAITYQGRLDYVRRTCLKLPMSSLEKLNAAKGILNNCFRNLGNHMSWHRVSYIRSKVTIIGSAPKSFGANFEDERNANSTFQRSIRHRVSSREKTFYKKRHDVTWIKDHFRFKIPDDDNAIFRNLAFDIKEFLSSAGCSGYAWN
jgi:hypothetical protein